MCLKTQIKHGKLRHSSFHRHMFLISGIGGPMRRLSCSSFSRLAACSHIHSCLVQPSGELHAPGKIENSRQIIWSYFGVYLIGDTQKLKKWMVYNGHSYQNAWFRGTPILEHLHLDPFGSNLVWLCLYGWSLDLSMNVHNQTGQLYSSATCQVDLDYTSSQWLLHSVR